MKRSVPLDALRGAAVLSMVFVNSAGLAERAPAWLRHAAWNGCGLADLVAPLFLLAVGASIPFSRRSGSAWRVLARAAGLFAAGVFINAFWEFDWTTVRVLGFLQRIAVAYLLGAALCALLKEKGRLVAAALILAGWAWASSLYPATKTESLASAIDRALVPRAHLLQREEYHGLGDPEGLGTALPAAAVVLLGAVAGDRLKRGTPSRFAAWGGGALLAGLLWSRWLPFNRQLGSSSLQLFACGAGLLILGAARRWLEPRPARLGAALSAVSARSLPVAVLAFWGTRASPLLAPLPASAAIAVGLSLVALVTAACRFHAIVSGYKKS